MAGVVVGDLAARFTPDKFQAAIEKALGTVPAGKRGALLVVADTEHGGRVAAIVATRAGNGWEFAAQGEYSRADGLEAGVVVRRTW